MKVALLILMMVSQAHAWTVERTEGDVKISGGGKTGEVLKEGADVTTAKNAKALIKDGESEVWLAPETQFKIAKLANDEKETLGRLDVLKGRVRAKFKRPAGPQEFPYQVKAKTVVAGVRGTMFIVAVEGGEEKVCTIEGLVRVSSSKSSAEGWDVPAGKGLFVKPNEMPKVRETTEAQKKGWLDSTTFKI